MSEKNDNFYDVSKPEDKILMGQERPNIRIIAHAVILVSYSLIGAILLSFVLDPKSWQWILLVLPGAGLYVAHVASTYKEILENNVCGRTIFGWCVGWAEAGPAFRVPIFEKFVPPVMEGTDGGATIHTKLFAIQLYSSQFEPTKETRDAISYQISSLELKDVLGVGVDAMFWFKIAKDAKTKKERYNAYYQAVFVGGKAFIDRLEAAAEGHTRTVYGSTELKDAIKLSGENLWEDDSFSEVKEDTEDAFRDVGVGIVDSKGMIIRALGVPEMVMKATQKKKEDELLGEGDRKRVKKGVEANIRSLMKNGFSRFGASQIVLGEEGINMLPNMKNPKFFLGSFPGTIPSPKSDLMPDVVFDASKEDGEENDEKSNSSKTKIDVK